MASGRIQPGSRQWVEAMRRLSGTEDTTVDMSMGRKVSRDAAIPHGMGTAALDTRLRGGGGLPEYDYDARDPDDLPVGPAWLKLNGYTRPVGEARQGPVLEFLDGAPGVGPWRFIFDGGQSAGQWIGPPGGETTLLAERTGIDLGVVSDSTGTVLARFLMDIPADMAGGERRPPLPLADQVRDIIGDTEGFAFDPMDFATVLTTGSVPVTALGQPVVRQNSKWGGDPVSFSGGGANSTLQAQGINLAVLTTGNNVFNGDTALRAFFQNREAVFICQAMQPAARPPARAHAIAASQLSGAMGRITLHTDFDLSVTFNYRRTDLGDGAGKLELPPNTLVPGRRTVVSCQVDFAGGGARIWADGVAGGTSAVPAAGGNLENTLPARVRVGSFTAGGVSEFYGGGLGRSVFLPFIPSDAQRQVIEAWVAEPSEVAMATYPDPTLDARVQGILRATKGFALNPQDLTTLFQDDEATIPVTAPGQPVGAIRAVWGQAYTFKSADATGTVYAGDGVISHDGLASGLLSPNDNFSTGNTGMTVAVRMAMAPTQDGITLPLSWSTGDGEEARLAVGVDQDRNVYFFVARPDSNVQQIGADVPLSSGGAPHTLSMRASFATSAAMLEGFVDGVRRAQGGITGSPLVTDAARSLFAGHGAFVPSVSMFSGYIGRAVCCHFVQTDKDMRTIEEWVAAGPWPAQPPVDPPPPVIDPPDDP